MNTDKYIHVDHREKYEVIRPLLPYIENIERKLSMTNFSRNVFIMIKYRKSNEHLRQYIKELLHSIGFNAVLANDENWVLTNDDVINPLAVIYCCKHGIAIFDDPEERESFNPNVAYELGIMHYQNKECLILINDRIKDRKPFDLISRLHKLYDKELEVKDLINSWIRTLLIREEEAEQIQKDKIAVAIVVNPQTKKFLLTRRRRKEGLFEWGFPAKRLKSYYKIEDAIVFECEQETGITPKPITKIGSRIHPDTGKAIDYWLCEYEKGDIKIGDNDEISEVNWLTGQEVLDKIKSSLFPAIRDILIGETDVR